jgi:hypothetical protein
VLHGGQYDVLHGGQSTVEQSLGACAWPVNHTFRVTSSRAEAAVLLRSGQPASITRIYQNVAYGPQLSGVS